MKSFYGKQKKNYLEDSSLEQPTLRTSLLEEEGLRILTILHQIFKK